MQSDTPLDLTSMTQIKTILAAVQTTIQDAVTAGTFSTNDVVQQVSDNILQVRLGWLCGWFQQSPHGGRGS